MTHLCLACEVGVIATYRAFCQRCFGQIPWELRADIMDAYRKRVTARALFEEKLVALKTYLQEHRNARAGEQQLP